MNALTHGSTFSGTEGFGLGFAMAGIETRWQAEKDKQARAALEHHNPHIKRFKDVRDVSKETAESVDIISGGFPCQDISVAGRREGLAGKRSGLWFEFLRILEDMRPRWCVIENVPNLLSVNGGRDFATILRGLVGCGYGIAWRILDARYWGVAQRRRRVFIVGHLGASRGRAAKVLFESEGMSGNTEARREAGPQVAGAIAPGAHASGFNGQDAHVSRVVATFDPRNVTSSANRTRVENGLPANTLHKGGLSVIANTMQGKAGYRANVDETLIAFDYCAQGSERTYIHRKDEKAQLLAGRPDAIAWDNGQGDPNFSVDGKAFALNTSAYQGVGVRRLTPTECERLQGFPDGHTAVDDQSDSARYRQLGNAVCVPVVAWLGARIVAAEAEAEGES